MNKIYYHLRKFPGQILLTLAMSGFCLPGNCADTYEDTQQLKSRVNDFVITNVAHDETDVVSVQVSQLDSLKLRSCEKKLDLSFAKEGMSNQPSAVILSCASQDAWNVYVPVQIQIMTKVLSVNRPIATGETIDEQDLDLTTYDKNRLYDGFFKSREDVIGMSAARSIAPGTPLTRKNVKQLAMIKRNQTITLALRRGAIEIEMIGVAKSDGYKDGPVKVFNPSSKKTVDAVVVGRNRAEITY